MLNDDPVRTAAADKWRVTFSKDVPQGSWREKFLAKAQTTPEGVALGLRFEGSTLEFSCPDSWDRQPLRLALRVRMRVINELLKATKP